MKEFSGYLTIMPIIPYDEDGVNYEDQEGNDYPVNPFEYIPDLPGFTDYEDY